MIHARGAGSHISQEISYSVIDESLGSTYKTKVELPVLHMNHTN